MCQTTSVGRHALAVVLVVAQLTLAVSGCVTVQTSDARAASGPGGGVAVEVFPDDGARKAARPGPAGVLGELERSEGGAWIPVFRSLNPAWTVAGLPPGAYRIRFPARLDDAGNVVRIDAAPTEVKVKEGRITDVRAVLSHVPTALIVAGAVTVVAVAVVASKYLKDHDLPLPPPPPPELLDAVFYVTVNLAATPGWTEVSHALPPVVTSHFPASGALVAARRPRVIFALSEPLRGQSLDPGAVTVLGESSGIVPGQVIADGEHWWVVWEPRADLTPGDTFHVTLAKGAVEDAAGDEMESPASFTFRTAK